MSHLPNPTYILSACAVAPICWAVDSIGQAGSQAWKLATQAYRHDPLPYRIKQKLRWSMAASISPWKANTWFEQLDFPSLGPFAEANPRLAFKPMRVYLSTRWDRTRRTKVILDTYRMIRMRGGMLRNALLSTAPPAIAQIDLGELGMAEVVLGSDLRFRKEGELTAILRCPGPIGDLATITFAFERCEDSTWICYIGCVQGSREGDSEIIKSVSKAMHGLRPKALMLFVGQEIARALGVAQLLGVGNTIQVHRRKHAIHIPFLHGLSFDYDALWTEANGTPAPEGWFNLPLEAPRRSRGEMKPNKRSMYTKRYAMMDLISTQIRQSLCL